MKYASAIFLPLQMTQLWYNDLVNDITSSSWI